MMGKKLNGIAMGDRPITYLTLNPGWHDLSDICWNCNMTTREVSRALRNQPIEKRIIQRRECVRDSHCSPFENVGSRSSTAYRRIEP